MTLVMVERSFEEPCDAAALQTQEHEGTWCLELHDITYIRSWLSKDNKRMLCLYEAPDAESLRLAQKTIDMPLDRAWPAHEVQNDAGKEVVVVERQFDEPLTLEMARGLQDTTAWCFEMYGVTKIQTYLSQDGHRGFCVYVAPDAEAVRNGNRKAEVPFVSIWPGSILEPSGSAG